MTNKLSLSKSVESVSPARPAPRSSGDAQSASTIRVLCVDDHAVLVQGLRAQFSIEGRIEVVSHLTSAENLVEEAQRLLPDVVILDIEMPGADAFETADRLKRACPEVKVIVLSAHVRDAFITACYAAGVRAYFAKSDELEDIVKGIYQVVQSRTASFILGPKVTERCRPEGTRLGKGAGADKSGEGWSVVAGGGAKTLLSSLTDREAASLRMIGKGLSRTQIAEQLCRSVKTIDGHQMRMTKKLGITTRNDLMRFSIREGLAEA